MATNTSADVEAAALTATTRSMPLDQNQYNGTTISRAGSYVPLTPAARDQQNYNVGVGKLTGLAQILCGSVTGVMGLLALVLHAHDYFMDLPLWAGVLYLCTGVFGISTTQQQTFLIGLYLFFAILSSLMSSMVMVTEGHATFVEANLCDCSIFKSTHMLYDAMAAVFSCLEFLVTLVVMYHCMAGLGCCGCGKTSSSRVSNNSSTPHQRNMMDFSNIPLPPAPMYPVLPPTTSCAPEKVPLE